MNTSFHLINDDDISSYDIGTPAFLTSSWNEPIRESLHPSTQDGQEYFIFIEPTISTYPIDPDTRQKLSDEVDKLSVEAHYLTVTSERVTPQLLRWEKKKKKEKENREKENREKENANHILEISIPAKAEEKPKQLKEPKKHDKKHLPLVSFIPEKRKIRTIKNVKLVPVRLKSGEEVKATRELINHFRQKVAQTNISKKDNNADIDVFRIQSESLPSAIHVPFADRLSSALRRISGPKLTVTSPLKRINGHTLKNGKISKPLKLRAALDKSTIAWSSTTKTRPKASLLDQLNSFAKNLARPITDNSIEIRTEIPSECKNVTPQISQNSSPLVPLVIKLKNKSQSTKLLPLSHALKYIASDTLNLDAKTKNIMTNGDFPTPT